jgi:hypothetical protein
LGSGPFEYRSVLPNSTDETAWTNSRRSCWGSARTFVRARAPSRSALRSGRVRTARQARRPDPLQTIALVGFFAQCLLGGCSFGKVATELGHAQQSGAEVLRRETTVAFSLCREEAAFTYFERSLKTLPTDAIPSPKSFDEFWTSDSAKHDVHGRAIPWASYCSDLDKTGEIFHQAALALGDYAVGIAALADAKAFDGTSLDTIGTGVGSVAESLQAASTVVSAAKDVGSATSGMASTVVTLIRIHELKDILKDSHDSVTNVLRHMNQYLAALNEQLTVVVGARRDALSLVDGNRADAGGFTPAAEGVMVFDLDTSSANRLQRIGQHITADRNLVALILQAEDTLTKAAQGESTQPAQKAADELSKSITNLARTRPEDQWP